MSAAAPAAPSRTIFYTTWDNAADWLTALRRAMPERAIDRWGRRELEGVGQRPDPDAYESAFVWQAPEALFASCRHLKLVCSLGAGSDHILTHRHLLAPGTAILRSADPLMADRMAEYVLSAVLAHAQNHEAYRRQQAQRVWLRRIPVDAEDLPVGLLGLGRLGRRTAELLRAVGFPVMAWVRSPEAARAGVARGVTVVTGADGLADLAQRVRVLVALVPETRETRGLINAGLLGRLAPGSLLVNPGRGGLMVEGDVLAALEDGRLGAAVLDAFEEEPLPPASPFWTHPRVRVTPHAAAISAPDSVARALAEDLGRLDRGERPEGLVDPEAGY